ncbi:MAG: hypothetical protein V3S69_05810 [Dehalococcoidales bacterium]
MPHNIEAAKAAAFQLEMGLQDTMCSEVCLPYLNVELSIGSPNLPNILANCYSGFPTNTSPLFDVLTIFRTPVD